MDFPTNKLLKLKRWVTVAEAARQLSAMLTEEVSVADIYHLGMDGQLALSLHFVTQGTAFFVVEEDLRDGWLPGYYAAVPSEQGPKEFDWRLMFRLVDAMILWAGVYDLLLTPGSARLMRQAYLLASGERGLEHYEEYGTSQPHLYVRSESGRYYELVAKNEQPPDFDPRAGTAKDHVRASAAVIPPNAMYVVRTAALSELMLKLHDDGKGGRANGREQGGLGNRERDTFLKMVLGMAIKGYAYRPEVLRSDVPRTISTDLAQLDLDVSDDTIRKYLHEAKERLLDRAPSRS